MTTQRKALQRGQQRYLAQQQREAVVRVKKFRRWLANGSKLRDIPVIPTDSDYRIARRSGKVK